jgi:hypothetical protein
VLERRRQGKHRVQSGNCAVTNNKQDLQHQIRIFGDRQHMRDWLLGVMLVWWLGQTCLGSGVGKSETYSRFSLNCFFIQASMIRLAAIFASRRVPVMLMMLL